MHGFRRTLRHDGGHSVSARVGQDYPESVRCLDGRSGGDVGRSTKTSSAQFCVGLGTSQILIVIMTCTLGWSEMTAYIVMVFGSLHYP